MKIQFKNIQPFIILLFALVLPILSIAQGPGDPGGDPGVPFDGGLSILLAAGAAYGIKKVKDNNQQKEK
ncbi:MAG: hypothetical protein KGZ59_11830 [Chitinophagaceae bacterium]|nr:hypothetical protein [Chitinophagaceae bacterium]